MTRKGWVYILRDTKNRYYIGSTVNVEQRMYQHRNGHTQTTNRMQLPVLVLAQEYATLTEARLVERKLKKLKRRDYIEKMVSDGFIRMRL